MFNLFMDEATKERAVDGMFDLNGGSDSVSLGLKVGLLNGRPDLVRFFILCEDCFKFFPGGVDGFFYKLKEHGDDDCMATNDWGI